METPPSAILSLASATNALATGGSRRSPFSAANTITTEWQSDPGKTK